MKEYNWLRAAATLVGFVVSPLLIAAEDQHILVTATRLDNLDQQPGFVTVITSDEIAASATATLPDLLATEAGVVGRSLYGNNATRASVDMRGFGAAAKQNTLILIDGRRLNDVDMAAVDFSAIPLSDIERIEIIRGGGSVLYGDSAGGGVINIISKKPAAQAGGAVLDLTVATFRQRQLDINTTSAMGTTRLLTSLSTINNDGYRDNNALQQRNLRFDMRTPLNTGEWFMRLGLADQDLGLPGARSVDPGSSIDEMTTDRNGTSTPLDYARQDGVDLSTGMTRYLTDYAELVADAGYRRNNQQAYYDGGGFPDYYDTGLATTSLTPRLNVAYGAAGLDSSATIGIDIYLSRYDSDRSLNPSTIGTPIHRLAIDQTSRALYASNQTRINDATSITAGGRIQTVRQSASDRYDAAAPSNFPDSEAPAFRDDYRETMWQLGIHHQASAALSVNAGIERAVRFATVDEIFEYDPLFNRIFSPLKPQTGNQYNAGFRLKRGQTVFMGNLYLMDLDNEIHFDPLSYTNINLDPTRRRGAEFSLQREFSDDVSIRASYTRMEARFREGAYAGNSVPLVAADSASLSARWRTDARSRISATLNYVGGQYFDNDQSNSFGKKIPAYTTVDLKYTLYGPQWNLAARINNAFDSEYFGYGVSSTTVAGKYNAYPEPGRVLSLSLSRRF